MPEFEVCEICGSSAWSAVYQGNIRDGVFGNERKGATVCECGCCKVRRLVESSCVPEGHYETEAYREGLRQDLNSKTFFEKHDPLQIDWLKKTLPLSLRNKSVVDLGCGAGNFLDHVSGLASRTIGIEPYRDYHGALKDQGHEPFANTTDAFKAIGAQADIVVSFHVIEHVMNPRRFLEEASLLLAENGVLVVGTPNRADILMSLLPDTFPAFFYRVVHRWYFDIASLAKCARHAGLEITEMGTMHRFGMSNALAWLRDRKPQGKIRLEGIGKTADGLWQSYLELTDQADTLYLICRRKETDKLPKFHS